MINKKRKKGKSTQKDENYIPKAFQKDKRKKDDNEIAKNHKDKSKKIKKQKPQKKKLKKIILTLVLIVIIVIGIILGISAHRWKTLAKEMLANENSIVIDTEGKEIAQLGCERKNSPVSLSNMPNNLKNAYVAIEDERFYSHGGVDIKRTGRSYCVLYFSFWKIILWRKYYYSTISEKFNWRLNR